MRPACPLCGGASQPAYSDGSHRMYRCQSCRAAFVHPTPSDEFLADFYARFHQVSDDRDGYGWVEDRMNLDFDEKIRRIRQRIVGGGAIRLLDVGCGKGFFVKACQDRGMDARGLDLSTTAIDYAVNTLHVPAVQGRIEDCVETLGTFDVVSFWATIEHLPDPISTLSAIRRVLKPGGYLFLDTGIGDDWIDRLLPGHVQWYDPPQHLFVFSEGGIRAALNHAGFRVLSFDSCFERSSLRKAIRLCRAGITAGGLRLASTLGRLRYREFIFTRFPIGNAMFVESQSSQ